MLKDHCAKDCFAHLLNMSAFCDYWIGDGYFFPVPWIWLLKLAQDLH